MGKYEVRVKFFNIMTRRIVVFLPSLHALICNLTDEGTRMRFAIITKQIV